MNANQLTPGKYRACVEGNYQFRVNVVPELSGRGMDVEVPSGWRHPAETFGPEWDFEPVKE